MICKNCGKELNEGDTTCPSCNTVVESENLTSPNTQTKTKGTFIQKISNFLVVTKNRLHITSIFDESISRTPLERKIYSKYFILLICSFLLVLLWSSNSIKISIPLSSVGEELKLSLSMKQIFNGVSWGKTLIKSTSDAFAQTELETINTVMLILSVITLIYNFATMAISISPFFLLWPMLTRSTSKRWLIMEIVCLSCSFIIHFSFFLVIKFGSMLINGAFMDTMGGISNGELGSSGIFKIGLNFTGFLFVSLYVVTFVMIVSTLKEFSKNKVQITTVPNEVLQ